MKTINLYYIYDKVGETAISGIIPVTNDLTAAIGFRDAYIKNPKTSINYKQLELVHFGFVYVDENGQFTISAETVEKRRIPGNEIMNVISDGMHELGIDDDFVDEE